MLRGWTRRGRAEMVNELDLLTRHAEALASQARATGGPGSAEAIVHFLSRARQVLATDQAVADVSRRELTILHSLAVRQVARAEREIHAGRAGQAPVRRAEERA